MLVVFFCIPGLVGQAKVLTIICYSNGLEKVYKQKPWTIMCYSSVLEEVYKQRLWTASCYNHVLEEEVSKQHL